MKFFKLSSLLLVFSAIFLLSFSESKSCQDTTTVPMIVAGCQYDVDFCVDCSTGPSPSTLSILKVRINDPQCFLQSGMSLKDLFQNIWLQANNYLFIEDLLCPGLSAPPCPDQSDLIIIKHWICWKVEVVEYFGDTLTNVIPCNYDSYCEEGWTWCYDGSKYIKTLADGFPYLVGQPDCDVSVYDIEIPTEIGETECFEMPTACHPY